MKKIIKHFVFLITTVTFLLVIGFFLLLSLLPSPTSLRKEMQFVKNDFLGKDSKNLIKRHGDNFAIQMIIKKNELSDMQKKETNSSVDQDEFTFIEHRLKVDRQRYLFKRALENPTESKFCHFSGQHPVIKNAKDAITNEDSISWEILNGPDLEFLRIPENRRLIQIISQSTGESFGSKLEFYWSVLEALKRASKYKALILRKSENYRQIYNLHLLVEKYPQLASDRKLVDFCETVQGLMGSDVALNSGQMQPNLSDLLAEFNMSSREFFVDDEVPKDRVDSSYDSESGDVHLTFSAPWVRKIFSNHKY